jgi:DNA repair exonuclease SbcCD ATPase subunit
MRLASLVVDNFKQFEHVELTFQPGFTVVKGANEAGKSTIQAAILVALFMDPNAPDDVLDEFTRWGQSERFRLRLEFEDQDVYFSLAKDFQQRTLHLSWRGLDGATQGSTEDPAEALHLIGDRLGAMTIDTYVNTACVRSEEVSSLPAAAAPLSQRLQAKMTGSRQADATEVLRAIDRELTAMTSGSLRRSSDTGPLRMARDRVDALHKMRTTMTGRLDDYHENLSLLVRRRDDVRAMEKEVLAWSEKIEISDRIQTLEEECALLEEHAMSLEPDHTQEDVADLADKLSQVEYGALASAFERVSGLEQQVAAARQREAEINERLAGLLLSRLQARSKSASPALVIVGVLEICASVAAAGLSHEYPVGLAALIGIVLIGLGLRSPKPAEIEDTREVSEELRQISTRVSGLQEECRKVLAAYGLRSSDELAAVVRELRPVGEAHAARRRHIADLLGERRSADRDEELRRVHEVIANRREELAGLAPSRLSLDDYRHADEQLHAVQGRREERLREVYRLEGELSAYEVNSEMLAALDEELAVEQVRLARIERRRKGLEAARGGLRDALSETLLQAGTAFRAGLAGYLSQITSGRYNQVEAWIDTDGLHLLVFTPDSPQPVEADKLSRATQDQIYLAARLTLLQLACEGRKPPLLLDDPFVNYDDERLARTAELLNHLDTAHQIILFTCTNRYDRHATSLIDLESAVRATVPLAAS